MFRYMRRVAIAVLVVLIGFSLTSLIDLMGDNAVLEHYQKRLNFNYALLAASFPLIALLLHLEITNRERPSLRQSLKKKRGIAERRARSHSHQDASNIYQNRSKVEEWTIRGTRRTRSSN